MRIFRTLVLGWLVGAALVVSMSSGAAAERAPRGPSDAPPQSPSATKAIAASAIGLEIPAGRLTVPVRGVERHQLHDTFDQARGRGRRHDAIDILAPRGTPVVAATDGTIRKLFTSRAGGLTIYQYDPEEETVYYYAHLDRYERGLREGDRIRQGQVIGYVGTTGNAPASAPHLHFAIEKLPPTKEWWKGSAVNPYPLLQQ